VPRESRLRGAVRALIADSNPHSRELLGRLLESRSIAAELAADEEAALGAIRRASLANRFFDVAIIDAELADIDAFAVAQAIRSDPALARTRLIVLNRVGETEDKVQERRKYFDGWLSKPVRPSVLFERISALLDPAAKEGESSAGGELAYPVPPETLAPAPADQKKRILVVDDNEVNLKIAQLQLSKMGYAADAVSGGRAAIEALARAAYWVVLMDCEMPDLDGYLATEEIRRREGSGARTRIVAMTAHVLEGARERCFEAGMDDYISKPVTQKALAEALQRARDVTVDLASS
jgi:CheY-like chemotaxis protein